MILVKARSIIPPRIHRSLKLNSPPQILWRSKSYSPTDISKFEMVFPHWYTEAHNGMLSCMDCSWPQRNGFFDDLNRNLNELVKILSLIRLALIASLSSSDRQYVKLWSLWLSACESPIPACQALNYSLWSSDHQLCQALIASLIQECICTSTRVCIHMYMHAYIHTQIYEYTYICTCTCTRIMHTHISIHVHAHLFTDSKSQQWRLNASDTHTHSCTYACIYTHICIYTYVLNLQRMCRRCLRWCQRNICTTHTTAHALVLRTPVLKCTQHSLQMNALIHIHTHICIRIHIYKNTHAHLWHRPNTLENGYWDSQSMYKYAYTYICTCIYMHTYTCTYIHAYLYINTCQYTYIHAHIHAHTYNMYICTHASTSASETTARQRLRRKPDLTPRSSVLLPVRCNLEGENPSRPAAQLPVHEERQISAEQPQQTAAHHTITTARRPDHNRSSAISAMMRIQSTRMIVRPSCEPRRWLLD